MSRLSPDQRTQLRQLADDYAELMYPGIEVIDQLSARKIETRMDRAYVTAARIVDFVIEHDLYQADATDTPGQSAECAHPACQPGASLDGIAHRVRSEEDEA